MMPKAPEECATAQALVHTFACVAMVAVQALLLVGVVL